jgi:AhpD family alkylhydroperoxidase
LFPWLSDNGTALQYIHCAETYCDRDGEPPVTAGFFPPSFDGRSCLVPIHFLQGDDNMEHRIDLRKYAQDAQKALYALENYIDTCGLDHKLIHLLRMRASQVNGCAYCIDMHSKDARALGETEQRLYELDAWRETPFYTDRERAALEWTEALTLVSETHVPDEIYESVKKHFSEKEIVDLSIIVSVINAWNRLAISTRAVPGTYKAKQASAS